MLPRLVYLSLVCLGLSACYLGDSGTKLWNDLQEQNERYLQEEAAKAKAK